MQILTHIISTLPVFDFHDSLEEVIQFFKYTTYSHVAITEDQMFVGCLTENDLETFDSQKHVDDYHYQMESFFATKETSWLDVLELCARNEANLLPVLNKENKVIGYYDLNDIVTVFIDTPFFTEQGAILVVSKPGKEYSFSEIAQIVESNNTKLMGAFITGNQGEIVEVTIKIGSANFNEVVQTFRRYNYSILYGNKQDQFLEDLKDRSDYLDKYLNV
ncbi:MAG: CBS domain-containing protein [Flavobacteriaceae bacterium]